MHTLYPDVTQADGHETDTHTDTHTNTHTATHTDTSTSNKRKATDTATSPSKKIKQTDTDTTATSTQWQSVDVAHVAMHPREYETIANYTQVRVRGCDGM